MQVTYFWLIYSCLIFGTTVLCEKKSPPLVLDSLDDKCSHNECGKLYTNDQELILGGNIKHIDVPWHVVIYRFNKQYSKYSSICGGSIIAPNLVISVAHCFWQRDMSSNKIPVNDGLYKVAVGKYTRDFTIIDNEFTKIINVETVYLIDDYNGPTAKFNANNIAIILLQNRISFNKVVAPVCIDWNGKYNEVNGDQGKVVSWGDALTGTNLLETSLTYIDHETCRNMYTNGFEVFVNPDKFCAGSTSGQGVVKGDSGAGLCFLHCDSYYLTGLVSTKDLETNNSIAAFTEIKYHIQWIRGLYNKLNVI